MAKTFRDALLEYLEANPGTSLKSVAEGAGVSYEQLKKVKQKEDRATNVEDARKIASYLGRTLEGFIDDPASAVRIEVADLMNQMTESERAALLGAGRGMIDERNQREEQ